MTGIRLVISFAPRSRWSRRTRADTIGLGYTHLGKAGMSAVVDRTHMEIPGNEHHTLNIVGVDKILQCIPLRLISSPSVGKLGRWIGNHGGEDNLPRGCRGEETIFQPL